MGLDRGGDQASTTNRDPLCLPHLGNTRTVRSGTDPTASHLVHCRHPLPAWRQTIPSEAQSRMNQVAIDRGENDVLLIRLAGQWELRHGLASTGAVRIGIAAGAAPVEDRVRYARAGSLGHQHPGLSRSGQRRLPGTGSSARQRRAAGRPAQPSRPCRGGARTSRRAQGS